MAEKIWFITGASRGFGRIWADAALRRGDKVVATARNRVSLASLVETYGNSVLPLKLDVTDREGVFKAVAQGRDHFGRLDVLINNAGYGLRGTVEEVGEEDARRQLETNVLGALWVTQAVLPIMRRQRTGHILSVSSISGVVTFPTLGLYQASKWALEGLMDTLSQEVAEFGIKVTLIEPGSYATDFSDSSSMKFSPRIAAYDGVRQWMKTAIRPDIIGDPQATAEAVLKVVDSQKPPLRIFLGVVPLMVARMKYKERLETWEQWSQVSNTAQGTLPPAVGRAIWEQWVNDPDAA